MRCMPFRKSLALLFPLLFASALFFGCIDQESVGSGVEDSVFKSGPTYGNYYPFAEGMIRSAEETLGLFMENTASEGTLENAEAVVYNRAYMGLVQEDVFRFSRNVYKAAYAAYYPGDLTSLAAYKKYLRIASQLRVIMACYTEDVHLIVRDGYITANGITSGGDWNGDGATDANDISIADMKGAASALKVNVGSTGSGTYITATTVLDAFTAEFTNKPVRSTFDAAEGVQKVVSGELDAAFFVTAAPSQVFAQIAAAAPVRLVIVQMPAGDKLYSEGGTIPAGNYPFQDYAVGKNATVRTLLAAGPNFHDRNVDDFLEYVYDNALDFTRYNQKWQDVSKNLSMSYVQEYPELMNYRAYCAIARSPFVMNDGLEPNLYSGPSDGVYHDLASELIWLMSRNIDVDLKEVFSTGGWENAYWMLDGTASMAIVQDDLYNRFTSTKEKLECLKVASMKKVMPLHYEYLHLVVNTTTFTDTSLNGTLGVEDFTSGTGRTINIGPKTSSTFNAAMNVIKTYGFDEDDKIKYTFDTESDGVKKVGAGTIHAAFVLSGIPNQSFYSHDTYDIVNIFDGTTKDGTVECKIIPVATANGAIPDPYEKGTIRGNGSALFENYPYPSQLLGTTGAATIRTRAVLVAHPAFDDGNIATFIKSVFRMSYYKTNPPDSDLWGEDWQPDLSWIPITKENLTYNPAKVLYGAPGTGDGNHGVYDDITGTLQYFVDNPFGWSDGSAAYFLTMFPGE